MPQVPGSQPPNPLTHRLSSSEKSLPKKTDRRVRRTKALLQQGLIELMKEKEIKDISVKELSDLADINRGTFYLHYNDIYDMLAKMEDELFVEFHEILNHTLEDQTGHPGISQETTLQNVFSFLERHRDVAQAMMGPHGDLAFVNRLKKLVQERLYTILSQKAPSQDCDYVDAFAVAGCIGVIETWLNHPSPRPPEEMAALCSRMLARGLFP